MTDAKTFAEAHHERFLEELFDFLRIPSVSTQQEHDADILRAAEWLRNHMLTIGMTRAEIFETAGHPLVYGEWLHAGDDKPTVLVYGHYDVQPAAKSDGWSTDDPFEPVIDNGNIIARGASDDKGQSFMHLKVFDAYMQTAGSFPVNIKMLFEGEEEDTSKNLPPFVEAQQDLLAADVAVISDTAMHAPGVPAIPYGLRGIVLADLTIQGPKRDLHSGMYGGSVDNPIHVLSRLIASFHDAAGRIAVEGFYDNVRMLEQEERDELTRIGYDEAEWRDATGAQQPWGDADYTLYERMGARPTLDMLMVRAGQVDGGIKAIVAKEASAHISCRLVPNQDPQRIYDLVAAHVEKHLPPTVTYSLKKLSATPAVLVDRHSVAMQKAEEAFERNVGKRPLFTLVGGSIPVVTDFQEKLGLPVVMIGFALEDDNIHAPNEKFAIEQFQLGIRTLIDYYALLAE